MYRSSSASAPPRSPGSTKRADPLLWLLALGCAARAPEPPPAAALWFGGDLMWGEAAPDALLAPLTGWTDGAAGVVNVEGAVEALDTDHPAFVREGDGERYLLRNDVDRLPALVAAGVVAAGVANNHRADGRDPAASDASVRAAGLAPLGDTRLDVSGVSVALTQVDLSEGAPAGLEARLRAVGAGADALVVGFHVVGPPSYLPRPELREAVDAAVAAGARVVVAHGTHAIGPVERRGDAVVAWGLGNLAMTCGCTAQSEALLLRVDVPRKGRAETRVYPVQAGLDGAPARPSPDGAGIYTLLDALGSTPLTFDADGVGWLR